MYRATRESAHPSLTVQLFIPQGLVRVRPWGHMWGMSQSNIAHLQSRAVISVGGPDWKTFLTGVGGDIQTGTAYCGS